MKRILTKITTSIEVFSNIVLAIMVFFMLMLLLSPLLNLLRGHTGLGWILLTILVMGGICVLVYVVGESLPSLLKKIKKGQLFPPFFSIFRNISLIIGIYSAFKLEYLLIHGPEPSTVGSWVKLVWEFITSF